MLRAGKIGQVKTIYQEYPKPFWVLIGATFVDRIGSALLYPFFALYVTRKFSVGLTEVGLLFGILSTCALLGSTTGGALADKLGRKWVMIFGLVASGLSSLTLGFVNQFWGFAIVVFFLGLFSDVGSPARQAMVADILPADKRAQGFGIWRVVANLAVTFGPAIGGLLATRSYLFLFAADAITSVITALIVALVIEETKPQIQDPQQRESLKQTFAGYGAVLRDNIFVWFVGLGTIIVFVYIQMETTLGVFLRDIHGVPERGYGLIISLNAALVVLFQFPITRWLGRLRPMVVLAWGAILYAVGFSMYGYVTTFGLFLLAMVIITVGEMFIVPISQAAVAQMAPEDKRARYMAVFGLSWGIPSGIGVLLAGTIVDNADPRLVWYLAGVLSVIAAAGYLLLEPRFNQRAEHGYDSS